MTIINWQDLLPLESKATVEYQNNAFGCGSPEHYEDFLLISFPGGIHIEVSWDDERDEYAITLSSADFDTTIEGKYRATAEDAIDVVREFVDAATSLSAFKELRGA